MSDFIKTVRDSANRATFEAARLYRVQQAQGQLTALQNQKQEKFRSLGEIAWDLFLAGQISEQRLLDVCREVKSLEEQIRDTGVRIEAIKQEQPPEPPKCPNCAREIGENDTFCSSCGTPISRPVTATPLQSSAPQSNCPHCHKPLRPGATFCGSCGQKTTV